MTYRDLIDNLKEFCFNEQRLNEDVVFQVANTNECYSSADLQLVERKDNLDNLIKIVIE